MKFNILYTDNFEKELKHLAKKYRSIKKDLQKLIDELETKPDLGTPIGKDCFKIRLAISSKGKGKSGGARIITHLFITGKIVYLLSIYDKAQQENISDKEIIDLINNIRQ